MKDPLKLPSGLVVDLYLLTMGQCYFFDRRGRWATFEVFLRDRNILRPFYILAGVEQTLKRVLEFRFTSQDVDYLKSLGIFRREFIKYLKNFHFGGYIWAQREGQIIFPQEPLLRIIAPILEVQVVESIVLNTLNLYITLATKSARVLLASKGKSVFDFSLRRTQGLEASLVSAYASYICGAEATSNLYAGKVWGIPVVGTMAHSFIESFEREYEAFLSFARNFPNMSVFLVDTYNISKSLDNVVKINGILKKKFNAKIVGVRIDSGDLTEEAKRVRGFLDRSGLKDVKIILSGNLDEYKIAKIIKSRTPVDGFGVGTLMGTSSDLPHSDIIFKICEISTSEGHFLPVMKLSRGKITYPGRKQVFRFYSRGILKRDVVGLDAENLRGKKLLSLRVEKGRLLAKSPSLDEVRSFVANNLRRLPPHLKALKAERFYRVDTSKGLNSLYLKAKSIVFQRQSSFSDVVFFDVDTQNDFMEPRGNLYVEGSRKIIPVLRKLVSLARRNNIKIISSADAHPSKSQEFKKFPPHCVKGTWGQKKIKETTLEEFKAVSYKDNLSQDEIFNILLNYPQVILEKDTLDVFTNPNTSQFLKFFRRVFVWGVVTEFCVKKAVEGLLKEGLEVFVIKDAIKEIDRRKAYSLLKSWRKKGVKIINSSTLGSKL